MNDKNIIQPKKIPNPSQTITSHNHSNSTTFFPQKTISRPFRFRQSASNAPTRLNWLIPNTFSRGVVLLRARLQPACVSYVHVCVYIFVHTHMTKLHVEKKSCSYSTVAGCSTLVLCVLLLRHSHRGASTKKCTINTIRFFVLL